MLELAAVEKQSSAIETDNPSLSEDDLLRLAQAGDDRAYAHLLLKLEMPVRRFVRRLMGDHDTEDDIVQDVFIKLYQHIDAVDPGRGVRPYLFRIARNRCYDEMRRWQRRETVSLDDEPVEAYASLHAQPQEQPEEIAHWLLIQLEVREAMDRLPDNQREALILFSEEEMSYAEIADVTDTSIGTVKSRLFHAKKNLRGLLRPETLRAIESEFTK